MQPVLLCAVFLQQIPSQRFLSYSICFTTMSSNVNNNQHPATSTFVIENFSRCITCSSNSNGIFYPPSDSNIKLLLYMNPGIDISSTCHWNRQNVSFSIFLSDSPNQGTITVRYRMSIVNAQGQKCNPQEGKIKLNYRKFGGLYILSRDDLLDTSNGWLVNDTLTVHCEVYVIDSDLVDESTPQDESIKPSSMSHNYGSLFESGKLSDAVLVAGATEFKVHKTVLAARSPVFGAMFEHDTKESQENRIEVKDVSAETYHELLRYIYTDKVEKMEENALELMVAADKYQLDHLKSACEQYLCANLSTQSVAITLVMSDMYRVEALKAKCIEHISDNARAVEASEGWKTLLTKPELLSKVLLHLYDRQNK